MNSASGGTSGGRGSHRSRLALYVGIGFFMASVAIAGYGLFGPSADAAAGPSLRAADVATNVPATISPTATVSAAVRGPVGAATLTPAYPTPVGALAPADLAKTRAELDEIAREISALQAQMERQGLAPMAGGSPAGNGNAVPTAGVSASAGTGHGGGMAMDAMGTMASTLDSMMSELHSMMSMTDQRALPPWGMGPMGAMGGPGPGMGPVGGSMTGHH